MALLLFLSLISINTDSNIPLSVIVRSLRLRNFSSLEMKKSVPPWDVSVGLKQKLYPGTLKLKLLLVQLSYVQKGQ